MAKQMPTDIKTEPLDKLYFNAPFKEKKNYKIAIINTGAKPLAWCVKSTNVSRISFDPSAGVLDANETFMFSAITEVFEPTPENLKQDQITIEWILAPDGEGRKFNREWMQRDVIVRRKHITVFYNP
ncbi:hypothetical protein M514_19715 [Trichuris suis]|uniref:Major sperm protein n=1 Tax=Trichuris suis TaxID=68888 RepID=A0A085NEY0_9BILA|nr:hypothetical protein M514_19715 [Trichuris suis]KHJ47952.1 MSP domain protein [Trichuris suis]